MGSVTFEERAECLNAIKTKRTSGHCVGTFVAVIYHFLTLKMCFSLLPLSILSLSSRPALGPTQPPVQWVPGVLSPGVKRGRGVMLTTHPPT
jgi:hypothetical protein